MKRIALAALLTTATATSALAAGLDRSGQSVLAIFSDPGTISFSSLYVKPTVKGTDTDTTLSGSYDIGESYVQTSLSYANALQNGFSYAVIFDQPFGGNIKYSGTMATDALTGTSADFGSDALTFLGRYKINGRWSAHGGVRIQQAGGTVSLGGLAYGTSFGVREAALNIGMQIGAAISNPATALATGSALVAGGYTADQAGIAAASADLATSDASPSFATAITGVAAGINTAVTDAPNTVTSTVNTFIGGDGYNVAISDSIGYGYTFGAAYEIPDIALRLAFTYHSAISHSGTTTETTAVASAAGAGQTDFKTPQSVNIDFQTGINERTLLTAGLRWSEWGVFDVIPTNLGSDLADLDDGWRWNVGVARRFTENFAGVASVNYEKANGSATVSPLGPNDGQIGLSVGGRYTAGSLNISGGINYTELGDTFAGVQGQPVARFEGNSVIGVGFKLDYRF